ncbi:MAG: FG-GAP repeat protein, partial [Phycisphaerales bacterium]|nr:FG-GAP repeat protein [Phycisphaerales bacterium]
MTTRLAFLVTLGLVASASPGQILGEHEDRLAFRASDGRATEFFGYALAVSGRVAAAGAFLHGNDNRGAAYIFRYDQNADVWNQEQKLQASDGASGDEFGVDVDTTGSITVVGAFFDDIDGLANAGSAYVFRYDTDTTTWIEEQKLVPGDPETGAQFGKAIAISGSVVVVGAALDDEGGNNAGAAYVYRYDA